jgi:cytochrome c-type biogenesis protein CcsB
MAGAAEHGIENDAGQTPQAVGNALPVFVGLGVAFLLIMGLLGTARSGEVVSEANLLYVTLVFYAAASALYIGFGVGGRENSLRYARLATWIGFAANTLAGVHRWYAAGHPPFASVYEMLLSYVWTLAALTLLLEWRYGVRVLGSVTLPLATLGVVLMHVLPAPVRPLVPALQSTWLHIHVTLAMLAYAACAVSFALALLFLLRDNVRTESFLVATGVLLAGIYAGIATRFDSTGGLRVVAWDPLDARELFIADKTPLWVVIPNLGWLFFLLLAAAMAPLLIYVWARVGRAERGLAWANRSLLIGTALQIVVLTAFVLRVRTGSYPSPQAEGLFPTHLSASPFILSGVLGGIVASLLYLMLAWRRESLERHLPAAPVLDRMTYKTIGIAFPLLTLMIAAGAYWANRTWGSYWSWDPKETWALITWLVYAGYLHMRFTRGWRGRRAAYFAILGFAIVLFTFFGVTYLLPGLHAYS